MRERKREKENKGTEEDMQKDKDDCKWGRTKRQKKKNDKKGRNKFAKGFN